MKNGSCFILVVSFLLVNYSQATAGEVQIQSLMKTQLEGVGGTEVIVSKVTMPANTSLPKHWHPGEEFVYILEGSVTLWQKGKEDVAGNVGELIKVPLRQIHTGITGKEGATLIVFRVHEQGQPERVKAE